MFLRIDRRARTLLVRSFQPFAAFIEATEYVVLHFLQVCGVAIKCGGCGMGTTVGAVCATDN